jgi:hypothetical protein
MMPAGMALADGHLPPLPIKGPRLSPPPIPHTDVIEPTFIYNFMIVGGNLPEPAVEADEFNAGALQPAVGTGIKKGKNDISEGITLLVPTGVCNDFGKEKMWASENTEPRTDVWTDWFAGWAPFAIDDGYYQAKNTVFSRERVVGPGVNFGKDQNAVKISSNQPYAGGFGSPLISVEPGAEVTVMVDYLIWDHDTHGYDYDWASMGVKPDAYGDTAEYVNGYVRGEWAELSHTVKATGEYIMVLIQGHSPVDVNSNIYFDNVRIMVDGEYVKDCTLE